MPWQPGSKVSYESLEDKVRDRTTALALANAELQREVAERQQAEEKFRGLLESAPDAMVIANQQGEIVLVNAQTETALRLPARGDCLANPSRSCCRSGSVASIWGTGRVTLPTPLTRPMGASLELYGRRKDGRAVSGRDQSQPFADRRGSPGLQRHPRRHRAQARTRRRSAHHGGVGPVQPLSWHNSPTSPRTTSRNRSARWPVSSNCSPSATRPARCQGRRVHRLCRRRRQAHAGPD